MPTNSVTICHAPFDPTTWTRHECDDIHAFLQARFDSFPPDARIYHEQVAYENDVTPTCEAGIARLGELGGHLYVVLYPAGPAAVVAAVVAVVAVAAAVALAPDVPDVASPEVNNRQQSPNNQIAQRQNRPRIGSRIPDIFGTVRAFPDLLTVPYRRFVGNIEYERSYMCLGRGEYDIEADSVREGTTMLSSIGGTGVEIYDPFKSPNSGDAPYLTVGSSANERVARVDRADGVNNQVLIAANEQGQVGANNIMFRAPNLLVSSVSQDFPNKLTAGTDLTISNAEVAVPLINQTAQTFNVSFTGGLSARYYGDGGLNVMDFRGSTAQIDSLLDNLVIDAPNIGGGDVLRVMSAAGNIDMRMVFQANRFTSTRLRMYFVGESAWTDQVTTQTTGSLMFERRTSEDIDFSGTYRIETLADKAISFVIPRAGSRSPAPGVPLSFPFAAISEQATDRTTATTQAALAGDVDRWVGPFVVDSARQLVSNFVAPSGLYSDDGENQRALEVEVELEARRITEDAPTGGQPTTFRTTLRGSADARTLVASTLDADLSVTGQYAIRARRVSNTNLDFNGSYIDQVRWRDMYGLTPVPQTHFGNVTTLQAITQATQETSRGIERKLNLLATRCVQRRGAGPLIASDRADDILTSVCLDPYIGNRAAAEVDMDNFYDTLAAVRAYFGTDLAGEFGYTFDQNNLSFEEIVAIIARAVFCEAYRVGNVIRIKFERATDTAGFLFNHANKVPGSEVRSRRFGNANENDGIEYEWVDPADSDIRTSIYYPADRSALRPRKVESLGVRNRTQAFLHARRLWAKIQHQNVITEFEGTREANLVSSPDRILVADNTRQGTQDGTVISQDGLALELSEPVDLSGTGPYRIFLQHTDGTTEAIQVTAGADSRQVMLAAAPRQALNLDVATYARTTYILGNAAETAATGFLVAEKRIRNISTASIRAVNYDPAYYLDDACPAWADARQGLVNAGYRGGALLPVDDEDDDPTLTIDDGRFVVGAIDTFAGAAFKDGVSFTGPFTVAVSIAFTATDGVANLLSLEGSLSLPAPMFIVNATSFGISAKAGEPSSAFHTFELNRAYHIAGTYDNDAALRLYVDGGEVAATMRIRGLTLPSAELRRVQIGGGPQPQMRNCNFNNLRLYHRVLGPEEIARLASLNI